MKHAACILALLLSCAPAAADEDHDRARRALEEGRILPLTDILSRAEAAYPGHLIEAELEEKDGVLVYEIKILTFGGRVMKLYYDAGTGALLKAKGREKSR
tara:strand:- start:7021 stop:7323 length:303 start_codon:yes stop_codon:yes gene_type:complete